MCLIIASQQGKLPDEEILRQGWVDNSDGWGLMQSDGSEVRVNKGLHFGQLEGLIAKLNGNPYVIHYRWATHGNKNVDNCHPFKITKQLYMAHNGVINIECSNKLMSDTWHFSKELIRMGVDHYAIKNKEITDAIGKLVGSNNKLTFLDAAGSVTIINEKAGHWDGDIWYSNSHSLYTSASDFHYGAYSSYYRRKYSYKNYCAVPAKPAAPASNVLDMPEKADARAAGFLAMTDEDYRIYEDGADLWDYCEYCNTQDWLEEVEECDGMILCTPCKRVLTPVYAAERGGWIYDSNGVPYSWDDVDEKIEKVREDYKNGRGTKIPL